ncbi:hypothetical protein VTL71DRAFT_1308 [Oculimacula yallundae]|uniref:FTP domain-containing protein n=1 Tax=Oculimacula yallundae TaxID=86028 RepID=A0ABR4CAH3_9HELO
MRFSVFQVASLGLISIGSVLLGGNALPTGIDTIENDLVTHGTHKLATRVKPVPQLEDHGYKAYGVQSFRGRPIRYEVKNKGVAGNVDEIRIDKSLGIITIENASNAEDKTNDRLSLSDIAMSLFVHIGGKQPSDLTRVAFAHVREDTTFPILLRALDLDQKNDKKERVTTVSPSSEKLGAEIFQELEQSPFGKMLRWLNTDFGVPRVTSYTISGGITQPDFYATIG